MVRRSVSLVLCHSSGKTLRLAQARAGSSTCTGTRLPTLTNLVQSMS
ncbi:hypothetical protein DB30_03002 [Enhygromyxa salina]|uniref:Uncharacterized protein n=1 Tax=Enhygromyxa salina TaxID=215803 RepID=A0A0C2DDL8_9BACT|nr:hypothetical protein DB30_03002 [Enhygromyxa salina]